MIVRFTDGIGGATLLDLSPGAGGITLGDGFAAPPPTLERQVARTALRDGAAVPSASFGLRTVRLPIAIPSQVGAADDTLRGQLTTLLRLLDSPRSWLEVRPDGASTSRWLHLYRCSDPELDATLRRRFVSATVEVPADPFAYGPKQTLSAFTTSVASPIATIAGSAILGDVPVRCGLTYSIPGSISWPQHRLYVGARDVPVAVGPVRDNPSTNAGIADADSIGGSYALDDGSQNVVVTTRAGVDRRHIAGTYRALLLVNVGSQTQFTSAMRWQVALGRPQGARENITEPVVFGYTDIYHVDNPARRAAIVDLGVLDYPFVVAPRLGFDAPFGHEDFVVAINVDKVAGGGDTALGLDALILMPADNSFLVWDVWNMGETSAQAWSIDPITGRITAVRSTDSLVANIPGKTSYLGAAPLLTPGVDCNVVAFVALNATPSGFDPLPNPPYTTSTLGVTLTPFYWPQYLTVV